MQAIWLCTFSHEFGPLGTLEIWGFLGILVTPNLRLAPKFPKFPRLETRGFVGRVSEVETFGLRLSSFVPRSHEFCRIANAMLGVPSRLSKPPGKNKAKVFVDSFSALGP